MTQLRSRMFPEEQHQVIESPTRIKTGPNQHELACSACGESYFVEQFTYDLAVSAIDDGHENPFCCDECEEALDYLSHER